MEANEDLRTTREGMGQQDVEGGGGREAVRGR